MKAKPLSWSVAMVCSLRPSEPKLSQQAWLRSTCCCDAMICTRRSVSRSFRLLMSAVKGLAIMPCPTRDRASSRMPCAACANSALCLACRMRALTPLSESRCMANKSRSETMPTTRPPSSRGTWVMPWRAISSAAASTGCATSSACTVRVITEATGSSSERPAKATRSRTSWRVKMPNKAPCASCTSMEPMRRSCMRRNTSRKGVSGAQLTGASRNRLRKGRSSDCSCKAIEACAACTARRESSSNCMVLPARKRAKGGLARATSSSACTGKRRQKRSPTAL